MENVFLVLGAIVVLGGGAWAGAKAAFLTTLFFKVLFGKASEPPQPQIVYVPVDRGVAVFDNGERVYAYAEPPKQFARQSEQVIIDVTPYR